MSANSTTDLPAPTEREAALEAYCRYLEREYKSFIIGLGDVLDSVEVWRENSSPEEAARWELLQRRCAGVLVQHAVRPTARHGQAVDLRCHQVVAMTSDEAAQPDTVVQIVQMGYELVLPGIGPISLRPSKVVLSSGPAAKAAEEPKDSGNQGAIHG